MCEASLEEEEESSESEMEKIVEKPDLSKVQSQEMLYYFVSLGNWKLVFQ